MSIRILQSFWQSFWQSFRQSFRHLFRHLFRPARGRAAALLLIISSVVLAVPAQPLTPEIYRERLARFDQQLLELIESRPSPTELSSALREVREEIPDRVEIASNGVRSSVDNRWIGLELETIVRLAEAGDANWRSRLVELEDRIGRLRRLLSPVSSTGRSVTEQAERRRLTGILGRPEYRRAGEEAESGGGSALQQWWGQFKSTLRDLLRRFLPESAPEGPPEADSRLTISKIVSLLLLAGLTMFGLWQTYRRWKKRGHSAPKSNRPTAENPAAEPFAAGTPDGLWPETPDLLFKRAARLADEAEYREAIRLAYLASLFELAHRQLFEISSTWTNRDYLEAVRDQPAVFAHLLKMTLIFEDFWYGQKRPLVTDYERTLELARLIIAKEP